MNKKYSDDWVCKICGDPSREYCAKGLCLRCYKARKRREQGIKPKKPRIDECVDCGKTARIAGNDRCSSCNAKFWRANHPEFYKSANRKWSGKFRFGGRRAALLECAGYSCEMCGMTEAESLRRWKEHLSIHHKDGIGKGHPRPNNVDENLQVLCKVCHRKIHNEMCQEVEV